MGFLLRRAVDRLAVCVFVNQLDCAALLVIMHSPALLRLHGSGGHEVLLHLHSTSVHSAHARYANACRFFATVEAAAKAATEASSGGEGVTPDRLATFQFLCNLVGAISVTSRERIMTLLTQLNLLIGRCKAGIADAVAGNAEVRLADMFFLSIKALQCIGAPHPTIALPCHMILDARRAAWSARGSGTSVRLTSWYYHTTCVSCRLTAMQQASPTQVRVHQWTRQMCGSTVGRAWASASPCSSSSTCWRRTTSSAPRCKTTTRVTRSALHLSS